MKTLSKIILLSFLSFFCIAQLSIAEECRDDPDQCTPVKLCDISTETVNGLKFWTSNLEFNEHVKFAKEIGINCGASDPKSPCDLDAKECKISELCEKATITEGNDVSWDSTAELYVELAIEYGLSCNVQKASPIDNKRSNEEPLKAERQIALLNQQLSEVRKQLGELDELLSLSEERDQERKAQLKNVGSRLNQALFSLASEERKRRKLEENERKRLEEENNKLTNQAEELANYKSEFFGRLSEILMGQERVRIVGDRFIFSSDVLFSPGSSDLSKEGKAEISIVTEILSSIMKDIPEHINWVVRVDGHTDNTPLSGVGEFKDNWELSQARALSVVKYMITELNFSGSRLAANGFGEYQPISIENTQEARAQNRRIEITLADMPFKTLVYKLANRKKENKETYKLDLRQSFISEPKLKRQQMQQALNILGYYDTRFGVLSSEKVFDGKWSIGTKLALMAFASEEGLETETPTLIFSNLLNKKLGASHLIIQNDQTSAPSNVEKINQNKNNTYAKKQNPSGWFSLGGNPKLPFDNAKDVCAAKAKAEERSYSSANKPQERSNRLKMNCYAYGSGYSSCSERRNSGGNSGDLKDNILAGVLKGVAEGLAQKRIMSAAKDLSAAVKKACMADYGWIKR